jgi:hypothetical protein
MKKIVNQMAAFLGGIGFRVFKLAGYLFFVPLLMWFFSQQHFTRQSDIILAPALVLFLALGGVIEAWEIVRAVRRRALANEGVSRGE